jgi:O-antigen biosynthesis protein WbqP
MKRLFDLLLSITLIIILIIPLLLIAIAVKISSRGPVLYWSDRVGINNTIFSMPKFRSMKINTPELASHLVKNPESYLSPVGRFIRGYSIDELPQLYSIAKGDMSFVGPRPALYNQNDLVELRTKKNICKLLPGLTGWAQVNGRDELSIKEKVKLEEEYLNQKSFWLDLKILWMTFLKVISNQGVSH